MMKKSSLLPGFLLELRYLISSSLDLGIGFKQLALLILKSSDLD